MLVQPGTEVWMNHYKLRLIFLPQQGHMEGRRKLFIYPCSIIAIPIEDLTKCVHFVHVHVSHDRIRIM